MKRTPLKWKPDQAELAWRRTYLRTHSRCEGVWLIRQALRENADMTMQDRHVLELWSEKCKGQATELHEKKRRSRGGSPVDPDNILPLCSSCHLLTEIEVRLATMAEMLMPSWEK